jgi:ABC-2 type transport system ATP-binding protein
MEGIQSAIKVKDLSKPYKAVHVLKGVNFSVPAGSIFALLGANGSGKTTTVNILTTLIRADGGQATVGGFDVAKQPDEVRRQISLTGQFAAVDSRLSARENLELIGNLRHVDSPKTTAVTLLDQFGLTDAADRGVQTFSGGMRRRLDIAMSLIGDPAIIFLDEPTTGFDPESRNEMWRTIRKLADGGTTVFLTTQYLEEADQLADMIAVLHHGKIVAIGSADELKNLVPSGYVEFTFRNAKDLDNAVHLLGKNHTTTKGADLTLKVGTNNSVTEVANIFTQLRDTHIEPTNFSQKVPTLDDVFMKIVGSKKGAN